MKFDINNSPDNITFWKGLGGHFDCFNQLIDEFIDNCISNFIGNDSMHTNIHITLEEIDNKIRVSIEDTGTGIKNLDGAFSLGNQECRETPLNEHGFGMKHALATADPENLSWYIITRTSEMMKSNVYAKISAPYQIQNFEGEEVNAIENPWGGIYNGTGTIVYFECSKTFFNTIRNGLRGGTYGFDKLVSILSEDIGFTYSHIIKEGKVGITLAYKNISGENKHKKVASVNPNWEKYFPPNNNKEYIEVNGEQLLLEYEFGSMNDSDYQKYYKRNMSSSGVELRINGRLIAYNLFKEIWGIEKHNSYNYLLIRINIVSKNRNCLPITRTSKNGIRQGDVILEQIYEWIRSKVSNPYKNPRDIDHEVDLFLNLKEIKEKQLPDNTVVEIEKKVFKTINARIAIDLYVSNGSDVIIYEGKKDITTVKDVYQLLMYWDGLTIDGVKPTKGILIASEHPESVIEMITYANMMKDINGDNYNLVTKTWKDEAVIYPPH